MREEPARRYCLSLRRVLQNLESVPDMDLYVRLA